MTITILFGLSLTPHNLMIGASLHIINVVMDKTRLTAVESVKESEGGGGT